MEWRKRVPSMAGWGVLGGILGYYVGGFEFVDDGSYVQIAIMVVVVMVASAFMRPGPAGQSVLKQIVKQLPMLVVMALLTAVAVAFWPLLGSTLGLLAGIVAGIGIGWYSAGARFQATKE